MVTRLSIRSADETRPLPNATLMRSYFSPESLTPFSAKSLTSEEAFLVAVAETIFCDTNWSSMMQSTWPTVTGSPSLSRRYGCSLFGSRSA